MADLTFNCATAGVAQAATLVSDSVSKMQAALILVDPTGTYDQNESVASIILSNVNTCIQNSRRNGKTVTLVGAAPAQAGIASGTHYGFLTTAVSSGNVNCTLGEVGGSEYTDDTALPTFNQSLGVIVTFYES